MLLKKFEVFGFKSFADKTELELSPGINAIVGPNGSGKSNISDAIRWALGEQSIRTLRGAKMEDVIFAGTTHRRPLGIAEVSLTFDNYDALLPLDFGEVTITRRVFRSGESEYLINKSQCRLKDLHELLAGTGLGRESMAVIGQLFAVGISVKSSLGAGGQVKTKFCQCGNEKIPATLEFCSAIFKDRNRVGLERGKRGILCGR